MTEDKASTDSAQSAVAVLTLRFTGAAELKKTLEVEAAKNMRTLNAEIIYRLQHSVLSPTTIDTVNNNSKEIAIMKLMNAEFNKLLAKMNNDIFDLKSRRR